MCMVQQLVSKHGSVPLQLVPDRIDGSSGSAAEASHESKNVAALTKTASMVGMHLLSQVPNKPELQAMQTPHLKKVLHIKLRGCYCLTYREIHTH